MSGDDLLIAETTSEGVLLRPAVALPVEIYSDKRIVEFEAAAGELTQWYERNES